jgi:hypothetical protein
MFQRSKIQNAGRHAMRESFVTYRVPIDIEFRFNLRIKKGRDSSLRTSLLPMPKSMQLQMRSRRIFKWCLVRSG